MDNSTIAYLILAAALVVGLLTVAARAYRQQREVHARREQQRRDTALRDQVRQKTESLPDSGQDHELHDRLSKSGAIMISEQIDQCLQDGLWVEAEQWALHAIRSHPDDFGFKLKLAEVYCRAGNKGKFAVLCAELRRAAPDDAALQDTLDRLAADILPSLVRAPPGAPAP